MVVHLNKQAICTIAANQEHALVDFIAAEVVLRCGRDHGQVGGHLDIVVNRHIDLLLDIVNYQVHVAVYIQLELLAQGNTVHHFIVEERVFHLAERRQHTLHFLQAMVFLVEVHAERRAHLHHQGNHIVLGAFNFDLAEPVRSMTPFHQLLH